MGIMRPCSGAAYVNRSADVVVPGIALAASRGSSIAVAQRCVVNTNVRRKRLAVPYGPGIRSISTPRIGHTRTQQHLLKASFTSGRA
jgi:hypothetical protein